MSPLRHAIVWIDHREADVYRFSGNDESDIQVNAHNSLQPLHHRRGGWQAGGIALESGEFFRRVAGALDGTSQILAIGPGDARLAFKTYMDNLRPHDASEVLTLDMIDHPDDEALLALRREHFHVGASTTSQSNLKVPAL